ncbi:sodium-dependent transporter family protein [Candidatus Thiomargarita nelsonii]|uniref:Transporter n=1 Tax=Candidatus Thiomargarita nelsonii TaxID=1003181 RepID=A0A176S728_9GAMM|nr:sodium-dependent transporter family protein [Candidatus Thiomargarita nelsonii]
MSREKTSIHGEWSSRLAFILAATGSAVGLGNIWKFPYVTGENGGGAFVIVYLLCIAMIGLPVMMAEVLLGKRGRSSPINTMRTLAKEGGHSRLWQLLGWVGVIAGFLILSYYSVVAGWALAYIPTLASDTFAVVNTMPQNEIAGFAKSVFDNLTGDPLRLMFWHSLFMVVTITMVIGGVQGGLERAVQFMMPALLDNKRIASKRLLLPEPLAPAMATKGESSILKFSKVLNPSISSLVIMVIISFFQ